MTVHSPIRKPDSLARHMRVLAIELRQHHSETRDPGECAILHRIGLVMGECLSATDNAPRPNILAKP